jgi:hypothetical protein
LPDGADPKFYSGGLIRQARRLRGREKRTGVIYEWSELPPQIQVYYERHGYDGVSTKDGSSLGMAMSLRSRAIGLARFDINTVEGRAAREEQGEIMSRRMSRLWNSCEWLGLTYLADLQT